MFDVGFLELIVIFVIGLLILGPERLTSVARTLGLWLGRAQRMFETVKAEVSREIAAEELKKSLEKQAATPGLYDIVEETKTSLEELNKDIIAEDPVEAVPRSKPKPPASDSTQPSAVSAPKAEHPPQQKDQNGAQA
jgi:sec-independent protein translocase protein TatB